MNTKALYRLTIGIAVVSLTALYFLSRDTTPDFTQFAAGPERKQAFIEYFTAIIDQENAAVLNDRELAKELTAAAADLGFIERRKLEQLLERYRVKEFNPEQKRDWEELLGRIDLVPASLALAQAASESGWGTSRFAREGNNYFGQWCFDKGCGLVPKNRGAGKTHEVADFSSASESVGAYIQNLNSNQAYTLLRKIRAQERKQSGHISGVELADGLLKYSERGEDYVREIKAMIKHNKLDSVTALAGSRER